MKWISSLREKRGGRKEKRDPSPSPSLYHFPKRKGVEETPFHLCNSPLQAGVGLGQGLGLVAFPCLLKRKGSEKKNSTAVTGRRLSSHAAACLPRLAPSIPPSQHGQHGPTFSSHLSLPPLPWHLAGRGRQAGLSVGFCTACLCANNL